MIKIPVITMATCSQCMTAQEVAWGSYGAEFECIECQAPAAYLEKR